MYKYLFFCKNLKEPFKKVIHIKKSKKRDKIEFYTKLSTLSTQKSAESVDYSTLKKEQTFCGEIIKIRFCRKNFKKRLTFEKSKYSTELNKQF